MQSLEQMQAEVYSIYGLCQPRCVFFFHLRMKGEKKIYIVYVCVTNFNLFFLKSVCWSEFFSDVTTGDSVELWFCLPESMQCWWPLFSLRGRHFSWLSPWIWNEIFPANHARRVFAGDVIEVFQWSWVCGTLAWISIGPVVMIGFGISWSAS